MINLKIKDEIYSFEYIKKSNCFLNDIQWFNLFFILPIIYKTYKCIIH